MICLIIEGQLHQVGTHEQLSDRLVDLCVCCSARDLFHASHCCLSMISGKLGTVFRELDAVSCI